MPRPKFDVQIARGRSGRPTGFSITKDGAPVGRVGIVPGAAPRITRGPVVPNLPNPPREVLGEEVDELGEIDEMEDEGIVKAKATPPAKDVGSSSQSSLKERIKREIQAKLASRRNKI